MIPSTWTEHELEIPRTLTCCVNIARIDHLQCLWLSGPSPPPFDLQVALRRLGAAKLIACHEVNMHPPLNPQQPVLRCAPGDRIPGHLETISDCLRNRWNNPSVPTNVYVPTKRAANLFGSTAAGLPELTHRDHDMLLADVFGIYLRKSPSLVSQWRGEHLLPKAGFQIKDPDAFLVAENGVPYRIVESGGSYSIQQIASLIDYAQERSLVLELW